MDKRQDILMYDEAKLRIQLDLESTRYSYLISCPTSISARNSTPVARKGT